MLTEDLHIKFYLASNCRVDMRTLQAQTLQSNTNARAKSWQFAHELLEIMRTCDRRRLNVPIIPIECAHCSCQVNSPVCYKWLNLVILVDKCEETVL